MTASKHREDSPTIVQDTAAEMVKYGITRVPTDYFYYKEYRYTNLDDAIAQARRQHPAVPSQGVRFRDGEPVQAAEEQAAA